MSSTSTATRRTNTNEPSFFQRYSPRGECPLSFAVSVVAHVTPLLLIGVVALLGVNLLSTTTSERKPVDMDAVEVEGFGGGPGGLGSGPGPKEPGPAGSKERVPGKVGKTVQGALEYTKLPDLKVVPKDDLKIPGAVDGPIEDGGDVWAQIANQQKLAQYILDSQSSVGDGPVGGGGGGGPKGTGIGNNPKNKDSKGTSKTGQVLNDQRRKELRWQILASEDGSTHLRKLQALKVTLMLYVRSKPGFALKFDLSKPTLVGKEVRAEDDSNKVRWVNNNQKEMLSLANVLGLKEVPQSAVIYLPKDLEADMARRELAYAGRQEHEIAKTVWDLRERDGAYDNEPYIKEQYLRPGVK